MRPLIDFVSEVVIILIKIVTGKTALFYVTLSCEYLSKYSRLIRISAVVVRNM